MDATDIVHKLRDFQRREDDIIRKRINILQELEALDTLLDGVRDERRTLLDHPLSSPPKHRLSAETPPRHPIYQLPTEILVAIFKFTVSLHEDRWQVEIAESFTPCKLIQVCRDWRVVALDIPFLWRFQFPHHPQTVQTFLRRSKNHPLDIVLLPTSDTVNVLSFPTESFHRWRSVFWFGSKQAHCRHILASLDSEKRDFSRLSELEISCKAAFLARRDSPLGSPPTSTASRFASLTTIKLSNICPTELSVDTSFPAVESISLAFTLGAPLVSRLCHFLARTPNVRELIFHGTPPRSDDASIGFLPVSLCSLRYLEWSGAPPRDLWYLFCILDAPHLESFVVTLDDASHRWYREDGLSPIEISSLLAPSLMELRHLDITCRDDKPDFIKLHIPALETLKIRHDGSGSEPLTFPALGSVFRDPRLVKLSELELRGFSVKEDFVQETLVYMKFLRKLTLDSCTGLPAVVCALSCGDSCAMDVKKPRKWTCPRLAHFVLKNCTKSIFKCLEHTVRARKHHSEVEPPSSHPDGRVIRRLKPLKTTATPPSTPRKQPFATHNVELPSTPNGSFVAGWPGQENARPCKIRRIEVLNCKRISLPELYSFTSKEYGVEHVRWDEFEG